MSNFTRIRKATLVSESGRYVGPDMDWTPDTVTELDVSDSHLRVTTPDGTSWELCENEDGNLVVWAHKGDGIAAVVGSAGNVIELVAIENFAPHRFLPRARQDGDDGA